MIDWKLAPERADRVVVRFYNGDEMSCKKVITRPTQTKTVADAVRAHGNKWPFSLGIELMGYSPKHNHYFAFGDGYNFTYGEYQICTRAEFEAYVKEQEGEKWTHETAESEYCRILIDKPDQFGNVVILKEEWGYSDYPLSSLKPIKPTISKAEAWDKLMQNQTNSAEVNTIKQQYDII